MATASIHDGISASSSSTSPRRHMSVLQMTLMTLILLGLQFTWAVELAYGTPFLESLGLSKAGTSLVWLAGPISGLIGQPLFGSLSDRCTSRLGRRRPFLLGGMVASVLSMMMIMFSREIGASPNDGDGTTLTLILAIAGFYIMDIAINCVQGVTRAMIVDIAPLHQQDTANAFASFMIALGNIVGYTFGFVDLAALVGIQRKSAQLQILCAFAGIVFVATTLITCFFTKEEPLVPDAAAQSARGGALQAVVQPLMDVARTMKHLPPTIKMVCSVQFFAWLGWFPFLFYSSSYAGQFAANSRLPSALGPDVATFATRMGSRAILFWSLLSWILSFALPAFSRKTNIPLKFMWMSAEVAFFIVVWCTLAVHDLTGATAIVTALGYSWAISMWVPFAVIGQVLNGNEAKQTVEQHTLQEAEERKLADQGESTTEKENPMSPPAQMRTGAAAPEAASGVSPGLVLGVHNIFIVLPQLVVALIGFIIFKLLPDTNEPPVSGTAGDSVGWLLRFGGVMALVAAAIIFRLPKTDA